MRDLSYKRHSSQHYRFNNLVGGPGDNQRPKNAQFQFYRRPTAAKEELQSSSPMRTPQSKAGGCRIHAPNSAWLPACLDRLGRHRLYGLRSEIWRAFGLGSLHLGNPRSSTRFSAFGLRKYPWRAANKRCARLGLGRQPEHRVFDTRRDDWREPQKNPHGLIGRISIRIASGAD